MFLSDHQIEKRAKEGMIEPFFSSQIVHLNGNYTGPNPELPRKRAISYGLSSYGYDARLDRTFLIPKFSPTANAVVDPKNTKITDYEQYNADIIDIPPHCFVLGQTIEYFRIPRDILALCIGKSTYARCGIIVNVTPLEPEWEGNVTIEISNTNVKPARIYAGEGIAQFLFAWCEPYSVHNNGSGSNYKAFYFKNLCRTSYADRKGKYQGQTEVTIPKI